MNKPPFTNLYNLGFEKREGFVIGLIENYQVIVRYNWAGSTGKPSVSLETLFNPKKGGYFMTLNAIEELNSRYKKMGFIWNHNFILREWEFNFRPPKYDTIFSHIEESIKLLRQERFEPLTLQQSDELMPEFEKYLEDEQFMKRL